SAGTVSAAGGQAERHRSGDGQCKKFFHGLFPPVDGPGPAAEAVWQIHSILRRKAGFVSLKAGKPPLSLYLHGKGKSRKVQGKISPIKGVLFYYLVQNREMSSVVFVHLA